jgi:hypothetical protein
MLIIATSLAPVNNPSGLLWSFLFSEYQVVPLLSVVEQ